MFLIWKNDEIETYCLKYFFSLKIKRSECPERLKKAKKFIFLFFWDRSQKNYFFGTDPFCWGTGPNETGSYVYLTLPNEQGWSRSSNAQQGRWRMGSIETRHLNFTHLSNEHWVDIVCHPGWQMVLINLSIFQFERFFYDQLDET